MAKRSDKPDTTPPAKHRRSRRIQEDQGSPPEPEFDPALSRLDMERDMAKLGKLLSQQEFESIEEANEFLRNLLEETGGKLPEFEPETPLEEAQALVYEAYRSRPRKAVRLAKQALEISPDCVEAYMLLGDLQAKSMVEAIKYYGKAVAAGERVLGSEMFEKEKGHFWHMAETRPYMRARAGLANLLWQYGQPDEAIRHYQEMLELNPGDNQGLRYILLNRLIQLYRNDEAEDLLERYDDEAFAAWLYNRALLMFRKHGHSRKATQALRKALEQNGWVPDYLLGYTKMPGPEEMPDHYGWGDEDEAVLYVREGFLLWTETPGAQIWLAEHLNP